MAITKNKTQLKVVQLDRELREERRYGSWGSYYYGWGGCDDDDYYSYDYYHDYCYKGYSDCECEKCVDGGYTTIEVEDAFGNVRRKCIPAGREWFRKSQIDILLNEDESTPITQIHSRMIELGLVA